MGKIGSLASERNVGDRISNTNAGVKQRVSIHLEEAKLKKKTIAKMSALKWLMPDNL